MKNGMKSILKSLITACLILAVFFAGVRMIDRWVFQQSRSALERELHQASEHCYAVEGRYPPDLAYLQKHYGIRTQHRGLTVDYRRIAPDRAPEITIRLDEGGAWA